MLVGPFDQTNDQLKSVNMLPRYCKFLFASLHRVKDATVGDTDKQFPLLASGKTSLGYIAVCCFPLASVHLINFKLNCDRRVRLLNANF